jgi:hypothetical protein
MRQRLELLQPVHAQFRIHNGEAVHSHPASSGWVRCSTDDDVQNGLQVIITPHYCADCERTFASGPLQLPHKTNQADPKPKRDATRGAIVSSQAARAPVVNDQLLRCGYRCAHRGLRRLLDERRHGLRL